MNTINRNNNDIFARRIRNGRLPNILCLTKFSTRISKYFQQHKLFSYIIKRIIYSLLILIIGLILVYIIFRVIADVDEITKVSDEVIQGWKRKRWPEYRIIAEANKIQERNMKLAGYMSKDLSMLFPEIFNFLYRICPIIPKKIIVSVLDETTYESIDVVQYTLITFGKVSSKSLANRFEVQQGSDVLSLVLKSMGYSAIIGIIGVILSYAIGVPLGIEMSRRKGGIVDSGFNTLFAIIYAIPTIGLIAIVKIFGPPLSDSITEVNAIVIILCTISIILIYTPSIVLLTRRYMCDEAIKDNIKFAAANGLSNTRQYYLHIFRVAGVKILRGFPSQIIYALIGVSFMTESMFRIPGFSLLSLAAGTRGLNFDVNVMLCTITISATLVTIGWLLSDVIGSIFDPRIKFHKA